MTTEWQRVSTGARIRICTDKAAMPGTREYDMCIEEQNRAAYAILLSVAQERVKQKEQEQAKNRDG